MPDTHNIEITIDDKTLQLLADTSQSLRVYKGVQGSVNGAFCTLWFTTKDFSETVNIAWNEQYGGYTDIDKTLGPAIPINSKNFKAMNPGDLMVVQDSGVTEVATRGDSPGDLNIQNAGKKQWICGMCQVVQNNMSPLCAVTLFGNDLLNITPSSKVLLEFDRGEIQTGTIVQNAWIKSILIDFARTGGNQVGVSYNIDNGWDAQNAIWAQIFNGKTVIADKLIEPTVRFRPSGRSRL